MIMKDYKADEGLQGNDKIEKAIAGLQKETTQEMLAHTLTVIRRRMKDAGQLIIAVEPPSGDGQLRLEAVRTEDGKNWWVAFTSDKAVIIKVLISDGIRETFSDVYSRLNKLGVRYGIPFTRI